ncbi:hypothetical protein ACGC1H_001150 [Rhizoctonia solani]|uniref:Pyridoxamine 5'-phosphate oxidase N-terminal domain-containing protein n=1 Tax=Rhizoctonia solani TaxID=456999 RepID=A0A8H3H3C3_9AGAM|nr:unnamed protein product [Rhizoctonia solani]
MGKFYDVIPDELISWIQEQRCFWVATAPLSASGHVNISPKGILGTFKIIDNKTFFYQDLTGSGVETAAHLRENKRITVLFNAFEGPPRIVRLFGTGKVHELGSPRYNELIPPEERMVGSRAAIVVDVHKVGTSCGFSVPLYEPAGERTKLHEVAGPFEEVDRKFANEREGFEATSSISHLTFIPSASDPSKDDHSPKGIKEHWSKNNVRSIDGLPALLFCRQLGGLPPEAVKEDRKLFHEDVVDKTLVDKLGDKAHQVTEMVGGAGFIAGLVIGGLLSLSWTRLHSHV